MNREFTEAEKKAVLSLLSAENREFIFRRLGEEEMYENELELKIYDRDTGYGRIVLRTIDGAVYLGEDVKDTLRLVEDFIKERMGRK